MDTTQGTWVSATQWTDPASVAHAHSEECRDICAPGKAGKDRRLVFRPHGCAMPPFASHALAAWLRNRTLMFVGDSMIMQQYQVLVCHMQRAGHAPQCTPLLSVDPPEGRNFTRRSDLGPLGKRPPGEQRLLAPIWNLTNDLNQDCWLPGGGLLALRRLNKFDSPEALGEFLAVVFRGLSPADVVIFNWGLWWYRETKADQVNPDLLAGIQALARLYAQHNATWPRLMWREQMAQHWTGGKWRCPAAILLHVPPCSPQHSIPVPLTHVSSLLCEHRSRGSLVPPLSHPHF